MLGREESAISMAKQEPAAKGLTSKVADITEFVRARLDFQLL
jgi:hypothetical protein